jgi:hypothetical protein
MFKFSKMPKLPMVYEKPMATGRSGARWDRGIRFEWGR